MEWGADGEQAGRPRGVGGAAVADVPVRAHDALDTRRARHLLLHAVRLFFLSLLVSSDWACAGRARAAFFGAGQTLPTFRYARTGGARGGVHQAAVSDAIRLLDGGAWVHLFGEGRVVQPVQYALGRDGRARLGRFKWGV
jgi:hypothetical protein